MSCVTRCLSSLLLFGLWVTHTCSDTPYYYKYRNYRPRYQSFQSQAVPTVRLNSGYDMPMLGLGTWKIEKIDTFNAVRNAIRSGYRHIDTSVMHGNLKEIGRAIRSTIEDRFVQREDLFITSKLWATFHREDLVEKGLDNTLNELGLEYIDLWLIHTPFGLQQGEKLFPWKNITSEMAEVDDVDPLETWKLMESLVQKKKARSIGLSNFNRTQAETILDQCTIKPAVMQNECHPWFNQEELREWCESKGITMVGYSPLGSPNRQTSTPDDPVLMEDPVIVRIAKEYNRTPAQIILKYSIQRGVAVIPKSKNCQRMRSNIRIFDFELSEKDMETIRSLEKGFPHGFSQLKWFYLGIKSKYFPFHRDF